MNKDTKTYLELMNDTLHSNWDQTLGGFISSDHKNEIFGYYSNSNRFYHNLEHIYQMINWANYFRTSLYSYDNICRAIWYHDAIYTCAPDDEHNSAKLFLAHVKNSELSEKDKSFVVDAIIRTKNHSIEQSISNSDTKYFLDFDLSTLANEKLFELSHERIRKEFSALSLEQYNKGRENFFKMILDRPFIFYTDVFRQSFEQHARKNISSWLSETRIQL